MVKDKLLNHFPRLRRLRNGRFFTPFHLVTLSPWPFSLSFSVLILVLCTVFFFHRQPSYTFVLQASLFLSLWLFIRWLTDVVYESFVQGCHTSAVQRGLSTGFILFIFPEVMFFLAFFWAFFHSSLAPMAETGLGWPLTRSLVSLSSEPLAAIQVTISGLALFNPWDVPFLNTVLLLMSGVWLTHAHFVMQRSRLFSAYRRLVFVAPLLWRPRKRVERRALLPVRLWRGAIMLLRLGSYFIRFNINIRH